MTRSHRFRVPAFGLMLALCALLASTGRALADPPPKWSLHRVAVGVGANGVVYQSDTLQTRSSGFAPSAYASYGATSRVSVYGAAQRDFAQDGTVVSLGGVAAIFGYQEADKLQVGFGAEYVHYSGEQFAGWTADSWRANLSGSWALLQTGPPGARKDWGYLTVRVRYDPDNGQHFYEAGLRGNWGL